MRTSVVPFLYGFLACYLLASIAFGTVTYASQRVSVLRSIEIAVRWPLAIGLAWDHKLWLRDRVAASQQPTLSPELVAGAVPATERTRVTVP